MNNKEKQRERARKYYYAHKKEILQKQKEYRKEKYKTDPDYRQSVLEYHKKYEKEHYEKLRKSKTISQRKYIDKKRKNGEIPETKDSIINNLEQKLQNAIEYNDYLMKHCKFYLNKGHLRKMKKILEGETNE